MDHCIRVIDPDGTQVEVIDLGKGAIPRIAALAATSDGPSSRPNWRRDAYVPSKVCRPRTRADALADILNRLFGDLAQRWLGRRVQLTSEAALVLTRSVPVDDREAQMLPGRDHLIPIEDSLRDTIAWMAEAGVLGARHAGRLFPAR